jgi:hypothetical protein
VETNDKVAELELALRDERNKRELWEMKYRNLTAGDAEALTAHNLALKMDWLALASELEILNGSAEATVNSARVLTFVNTLRQTALANLEDKPLEQLVVMTSAYEVWYRACVATLQNKAMRIKVEKTREFEKTKKALKEKDNEVKRLQEEKKEAARRRTPEEIMLEQLTGLLGSREAAKLQYAKMQEIAKGLK